MKHLFTAILLTGLTSAAPLPPVYLRTEYLVAPLAVDTTTPRFSWKLDPGEVPAPSLLQSAYEIRAKRDDGTPLWETGKVESSATQQIAYAGAPLKARDRVTWQVRIWVGGEPSDWSLPASFGIGLLDPMDWQAQWISTRDDGIRETSENIQNFIGDPVRGKLHLTPAKHFRNEFEAAGVKRATLHATALGVFCVEINRHAYPTNALLRDGRLIKDASTRGLTMSHRCSRRVGMSSARPWPMAGIADMWHTGSSPFSPD